MGRGWRGGCLEVIPTVRPPLRVALDGPIRTCGVPRTPAHCSQPLLSALATWCPARCCRRVSEALECGICWVNCSQPCFVQAPWGEPPACTGRRTPACRPAVLTVSACSSPPESSQPYAQLARPSQCRRREAQRLWQGAGHVWPGELFVGQAGAPLVPAPTPWLVPVGTREQPGDCRTRLTQAKLARLHLAGCRRT